MPVDRLGLSLAASKSRTNDCKKWLRIHSQMGGKMKRRINSLEKYLAHQTSIA